MNIEILLLIAFLTVIAYFFLVQGKQSKSDKPLSRNCKPSELHSSEKHGEVAHSKEHRALIDIPYSLQCKIEVFTPAELDIMNKYGAWLSALALNKILPENSDQKLFVEECKRVRSLSLNEMLSYFCNCDDNSSIQSVWFKYLCRIKFERENSSIVNDKTLIDWGWQGPSIESSEHVFFSK